MKYRVPGIPRGVSGRPSQQRDIQESATVLDSATVTQSALSVAVVETAAIADSPTGNIPSSAPGNYAARSTGSGVVWSHNFSNANEISSFLTSNFATGQTSIGAAAGPAQVTNSVTGTALRVYSIGAQLTQNFPASGGAGPRSLFIDDAYLWPDPAATGPYYVHITSAASANQNHNLIHVTGMTRNGGSDPGATLTVTTSAPGGQPFASTLQDFFVGDIVGHQCTTTWSRHFSALKGDSNGRGVDDINNAAKTLRSTQDQTNFPWGPQAFGYGWYGRPEYQSQFSSWRPSDYTGGSAIDSVLRSNVWDGSEFYLQWRQYVDPTFLPMNYVSYSGDNRFGRKVWMLQSQMTVPQQIYGAYGPGATQYDCPRTLEPALHLTGYSPVGGLGGRPLTSAYDGSGSFQPGSAYASTAIYAQSNLNPTDAWEHPAGEWVTFHLHVVPGLCWHSRVNTTVSFNGATDSTITLFADPTEWPSSGSVLMYDGNTGNQGTYSYSSRSGAVLSGVAFVSGTNGVYPIASQCVDSVLARAAVQNSQYTLQVCREGDAAYTTVFDMANQVTVYGSSGPAEFTWTSALPGYNAISFTGYLNVDLGSIPPRRSYYIDFSEVIFSMAPIPVPTSPRPLPSWVPAAGNVALMTNANGKLTNQFADVVHPHYQTFYSKKIVNDYSGAALDLWRGTYGSMIYSGGGHAATNDNSVMALNPGASSLSFERVTNPSLGTVTDQFNNGPGQAAAISLDWGEYFDGQPSSHHSYGALDIVSPDFGGAAYGTLWRVVNSGNGYGSVFYGPPTNDGVNGFSEAPHKLDFTAPTGIMTYARGGSLGSISSGGLTPSCFQQDVPGQQRIYIESNAQRNPYWFDRKTNTYVQGTGIALDKTTSAVDGGMLVHVPDRNLLLWGERDGSSNLRIKRMSVLPSDTNPSWNNTAPPMSAAIPITGSWSTMCWCKDNQRLIVGDVNGDPGCVYEIEIPLDPTTTWTCTRVALPAGQNITWAQGATYKKWSYNPKTKSILFFPFAADVGAGDTVYVYRPRNT
jgi:hypothetical protein